MGVREIERSLERWELGVKDLQRRMILAPTPRERERWYAMLLLAQGWTAAATAEALDRDPHTIGRWASAFGEGGSRGIDFRADRWFPPALDQAKQEELKAAVQQSPAASGLELANWYWKGGKAVCPGKLWRQPEPQQLPELAAPVGICFQAAQETVAEG